MRDIELAIECLRRGEVIITPSESSYGLSCDAYNMPAVAKLNALKGRTNMPLTVLVADLAQIEDFGVLNPLAIHLSGFFHPGPLNLIIELKDPTMFSYLSPNGVAFRIPADHTLRSLIQEYNHPITTTSANTHGMPPLYKIDEVKEHFSRSVCTIISSGDLMEGTLPSTVFDTRDAHVVRQGPVTEEQINQVLNR